MRTRLRNIRKEQNLTQKEIAQRTGLSESSYKNIELGNRNPSWKVAQHLEKYFGIPASELLAEDIEQTEHLKQTI